jgi:hypothetical protein
MLMLLSPIKVMIPAEPTAAKQQPNPKHKPPTTPSPVSTRPAIGTVLQTVDVPPLLPPLLARCHYHCALQGAAWQLVKVLLALAHNA